MLGNQVIQNIKSQQSSHDGNVAALHANAAGQQGVYAGAMAGLHLAAGGADIDPETNLPLVTVEHVNAVRRLVDISVAIREMWQQDLEEFKSSPGSKGDDTGDLVLARAVRCNFDQGTFGPAVRAQPSPMPARAHRPRAGGALPARQSAVRDGPSEACPGPQIARGKLDSAQVLPQAEEAGESQNVAEEPQIWSSQLHCSQGPPSLAE